MKNDLIKWDIDFNKTEILELKNFDIKSSNLEILIHDLKSLLKLNKEYKENKIERSKLNKIFYFDFFRYQIGKIKSDIILKEFVSYLVKLKKKKDFHKDTENFLFRMYTLLPIAVNSIFINTTKIGLDGFDTDIIFDFFNYVTQPYAYYRDGRRGFYNDDEIIFKLQKVIRQLINDSIYIPTHTNIIPRFTNLDPSNSYLKINPEGENSAEILKRNKIVTKEVNKFLKNKNIPYKIIINDFLVKGLPSGMFEIRVEDLITKTEVHLADTGYGLSQLLNFIVLLFLNTNKLILKQEVETNLHPKWQIVVAEAIVESLKFEENENSTKQFYFLETHSEHIVLKLKQLIKHKKVNNNLVGIYYVYKDQNKQTSILQKINMFISNHI